MRFHIRRTSAWCDEKPCPKAYRAAYVRVDERTANDPKKIPAHHGTDGGWYDDGRNHRVVRGHIMRDFDDKDWFIDIETLEQLMKFVERQGSLVISGTYFMGADEPSIEIYDDYRE